MPYRMVAVILLAAGLTTSCAQLPTTPLVTIAAEQCEQNRGVWRPAVSYASTGRSSRASGSVLRRSSRLGRVGRAAPSLALLGALAVLPP
jgi:hypothetical protein